MGGLGWVSDSHVPAAEIHFTTSRVAEMRAEWGGMPTVQRGSWADYLQLKTREEILIREGLLMGLEQGDPVVRRRVAQKDALCD